MFYGKTGKVETWSIYGLVVGAAALVSVRSSYGFLSYDAAEILRLIVPIAGTFVALSLPAAQLARSVTQHLFSEARNLVGYKRNDIHGVCDTLAEATALYRKGLEAMWMSIRLSIASLLVGLAGLFDIAAHLPKTPHFDSADGVASLAVALLVAATLWFIPVVRGSVDLSLADDTIRLLRAPATEDRGAAAPPAVPATADPPPAG